MREATVRGLLHDLPQGYPALTVPEEDVWATGSADPMRDICRERSLDGRRVRAMEAPAVFGELYEFEDPGDRFPPMDLLEGFRPGDPSSPYRRVLVPVFTRDGGATPAWAYVARDASGTHLPGGRWPA